MKWISLTFSLLVCLLWLLIFFFFKQKTAYEMRISDWSSDVCSSDLVNDVLNTITYSVDVEYLIDTLAASLSGSNGVTITYDDPGNTILISGEIGRASCRERVCQYV